MPFSQTNMRKILVFALLLAACSGGSADETSATALPDLPVTNAEDFRAHIGTLGRPAVVNVWASWCLPCRSEAPLLNDAFLEYGDELAFIGVDVQDSQSGAKQFLAEFGLDFDHFFDRSREIPNSYGGIGTPITMFFSADGELVTIHNGVVDERTLAINIDELLTLSS